MYHGEVDIDKTIRLSDLLKNRRIQMGLSRKQLAGRAGVSVATIRRQENPGYEPRLKNLAKILVVLCEDPTDQQLFFIQCLMCAQDPYWPEQLQFGSYGEAERVLHLQKGAGLIAENYGVIRAMVYLAKSPLERARAFYEQGNRFRQLGDCVTSERHFRYAAEYASYAAAGGNDSDQAFKKAAHNLLNSCELGILMVHIEAERFAVAKAYLTALEGRRLKPVERALIAHCKGQMALYTKEEDWEGKATRAFTESAELLDRDRERSDGRYQAANPDSMEEELGEWLELFQGMVSILSCLHADMPKDVCLSAEFIASRVTQVSKADGFAVLSKLVRLCRPKVDRPSHPRDKKRFALAALVLGVARQDADLLAESLELATTEGFLGRLLRTGCQLFGDDFHELAPRDDLKEKMLGPVAAETIGDFIKERREAVHLTQAELARAAGVTQSAIAHNEQADADPSLRNLSRVVRVVSVDHYRQRTMINRFLQDARKKTEPSTGMDISFGAAHESVVTLLNQGKALEAGRYIQAMVDSARTTHEQALSRFYRGRRFHALGDGLSGEWYLRRGMELAHIAGDQHLARSAQLLLLWLYAESGQIAVAKIHLQALEQENLTKAEMAKVKMCMAGMALSRRSSNLAENDGAEQLFEEAQRLFRSSPKLDGSEQRAHLWCRAYLASCRYLGQNPEKRRASADYLKSLIVDYGPANKPREPDVFVFASGVLGMGENNSNRVDEAKQVAKKYGYKKGLSRLLERVMPLPSEGNSR